MRRVRAGAAAAAWTLASAAFAASAAPLPVIVDTDLGDDLDDAFALAFVAASPELDLRGVGTVLGDTGLRARMAERLLREAGTSGVPVRAGRVTEARTVFTQRRWATGPHAPGADGAAIAASPASAVRGTGQDAADQILALARDLAEPPTVLALGPLTNLADASARDPTGFRRLRRIVLMGGSVRAGYDQREGRPPAPPDREYNIVADVAAARAVFASGVPIVMLPLDATVVKLDEIRRAAVFAHGSTLTDALALLHAEWSASGQPWANPTPTLFDVVPVAWLLDPRLCPTTPLRIVVDADGLTREEAGAPNAEVCLRVDRAGVLDRLLGVLLR